MRAKKRAVSDEHDLPSHTNGAALHGDEPKDGDNLEVQRPFSGDGGGISNDDSNF